MNYKKSIMIGSLSVISWVSIAQTSESFYEKVEPIKKDLYKLFPEEVCQALGISCKAVPIISADQLKELQNSESKPLIVNVLTPNYFEDCHIEGSINAPLPALVDRAKQWDRSQKIVVYCALDECDAGEKGCILLSCMGFEDVVDYRGGIKEWFQLGYPTTGPAESEYLHTKSMPSQECDLYPNSIVCSRQTRWMSKYQK